MKVIQPAAAGLLVLTLGALCLADSAKPPASAAKGKWKSSMGTTTVKGLPAAHIAAPDLQITPKSPGVGPLYDFLIKNLGKAPSKESTIQFYALPPCKKPASMQSEKLLLAGKVKALVVTTSPSYAFSYSIEMPADLRGCRLKAVLNADHAFAEMRDDNNEAVVETPLPPAPDLVLLFQKGDDDLWGHKLIVKNQGNAPAGASAVHMWCSCQPDHLYGSANMFMPCDPHGTVCQKSWDWNTPALAPGQTHTISFPLSSYYVRKTNWEAKTDTKNQVEESNENNNKMAHQSGPGN